MKHSNAPVAGGKPSGAHFARYIVIGFFTLAPLWVTWLVLDFAFGLLAKAGAPLLRGVALAVRPSSDVLADWLLNPFVQYVLAALLTLAILYGVGLTTARWGGGCSSSWSVSSCGCPWCSPSMAPHNAF